MIGCYKKKNLNDKGNKPITYMYCIGAILICVSPIIFATRFVLSECPRDIKECREDTMLLIVSVYVKIVIIKTYI